MKINECTCGERLPTECVVKEGPEEEGRRKGERTRKQEEKSGNNRNTRSKNFVLNNKRKNSEEKKNNKVRLKNLPRNGIYSETSLPSSP